MLGPCDDSSSTRQLGLQKLEPRQLMAVVGDWAMIDLRAHLADGTAEFQDLSGVTFFGDQVAVTANVLPTAGGVAARLVTVDVDLDAHQASLGPTLVVPPLSAGGTTEALAVNSDGTKVYITGYSMSEDAPELRRSVSGNLGREHAGQRRGWGSLPARTRSSRSRVRLASR